MNYNNNESGNVMSYDNDGNSGPPSPPTKSSGFTQATPEIVTI